MPALLDLFDKQKIKACIQNELSNNAIWQV